MRSKLALISILFLSTACSQLERNNPLDLDPDPPRVVTTDPPSGARGVDPETSITIFFSEPIDPLSIADNAVIVDGPTDRVSGSTEQLPNPAQIMFRPDAPLELSTTYHIGVDRELKDLAGNPMGERWAYGFLFETARDTTPPRVVATEPGHGATVAIDATIAASFSEDLDQTTINIDSFLLNGPFGSVDGQVSYDGGERRAVFSPNDPLIAGQRYTAMITPGVRDLDGNALLATLSWTFTTEQDTEGPRVLSKSPDDLQTGVPVDTAIVAVFDEPLNPLTVDDRSFILEYYDTALKQTQTVAGTVVYNDATMSAIFSPLRSLVPDIPHTATLKIDIQDLAGNPLEPGTINWTFTTSSAADTVAPVVLSSQPPKGASDVAVDLTVSATFNEAVLATTVNASTFTLIDVDASEAVPGEVTYDAPSLTASFRPVVSLEHSTSYRATLTSGIVDLAGNPLTQDSNSEFGFTTAADTSPPVVLESYPENGAHDVSVHATVSLFYSEALDDKTVNDSNLYLESGGDQIAGKVRYDSALFKVTFEPGEQLRYDTTYLFTAATGIQDLAGNAPPVNRMIAFTTQVSPDITAPTISIESPADSEQVRGVVTITGTASDDYGVDVVEVDFDNQGNFVPAQSTATWQFVWDTESGPHAVEDGQHLVTVRALDHTGNVQSATVRVNVVNDAPVVLATDPTDLANGVPVTTAIQVDFDRAIDLAGAQAAGAVTLISQSEADREISGTVELKNNGTKLIFHPSETLKYNTVSSPIPVSYRFVVTTAIEDTAGRAMKQDYSFSFTTEASPDRASPLVVISSPVNGERVLGTVTIQGTASDDFGLSEVAVAFDGVDTFHAAGGLGVWVYSWDTSDPTTGPTDDGTHVVSVRATDTSDNTQFATVVVDLVNGEPTVLATSPLDNAEGVSVDIVVTAAFDRPMSLASLLGAVSLTELNSATVIPGQVTLTPDGKTVIFTPDDALMYNTPERRRYELRITTDAQDENGFPLAGDFYFRFATEDDMEPPVTTLVDPPDGVVDRDFIVFNWTGWDNADDPADLLYSTRMDNGEFSPFFSRTAESFTGLSEGGHVFQVKALDRSNNEELTVKGVTFIVDEEAPQEARLWIEDWQANDTSKYFIRNPVPIYMDIVAYYKDWDGSGGLEPELNGTAWVDIPGLEMGVMLYDDQSNGDIAGYDGYYGRLYTPPTAGITELSVFQVIPHFIDQAGREVEDAPAEITISPNWGGKIEQDTVITAADNPVIVDADIHVPVGVTLTIEAGVEILISDADLLDAEGWLGNSYTTDIVVEGTLIVQGTAADPVMMRSQLETPEYDEWGGIYVEDGSVSLEYLVVRDAEDGLYTDDGVIEKFDHVTVEHCQRGVYVYDENGSLTVTHSTFRDLGPPNLTWGRSGSAITLYYVNEENTPVTIESSRFENLSKAFCYDHSGTGNTTVFRGNVVTGIEVPGQYGVGIDYYHTASSNLVEGNLFSLTGRARAIYHRYGSYDVEILDNVFVGTAESGVEEVGIYFNPSTTFVPSSYVVRGNVFSHLGGLSSAGYNDENGGFLSYDELTGGFTFDHNTFDRCGVGIYSYDNSGTVAITNNIFSHSTHSGVYTSYNSGDDPVFSNNVAYNNGSYLYRMSSSYYWYDHEAEDAGIPGTGNVYADPVVNSATDRLLPGTAEYRPGDHRLLDESVPAEFHTISDRVALGALGGYSSPNIYNDGSGGWILHVEGVDYTLVGDALVNLGAGISAGDWLCLGYDWTGPWIYLTETLSFSGDPASQTLELYSHADTVEIVSVEDESGAVNYVEATDWTLAGSTLSRVDGGAIPVDGSVTVAYRYHRMKSVDSDISCDEWAQMGADGIAPLPQRLELYGVVVTDDTGATTYAEGADYDLEGFEVVRDPGGAISDGQMIRLQYSYRSPLYGMDDSGGEVGAYGAP